MASLPNLSEAKTALTNALCPIAVLGALNKETQGRWRLLVYPAFAAMVSALWTAQDAFALGFSSLAFLGSLITLKHTYALVKSVLWNETSVEGQKRLMVRYIEKETPRLDDFVTKFESSADFGLMYDVLTSHEISSINGRLHWSV